MDRGNIKELYIQSRCTHSEFKWLRMVFAEGEIPGTLSKSFNIMSGTFVYMAKAKVYSLTYEGEEGSSRVRPGSCFLPPTKRAQTE
jgi:hypothetical protein